MNSKLIMDKNVKAKIIEQECVENIWLQTLMTLGQRKCY